MDKQPTSDCLCTPEVDSSFEVHCSGSQDNVHVIAKDSLQVISA